MELAESHNFLLCNDENEATRVFRMKVTNQSDASAFRDGTYEIDFGNGTVVSNLEYTKEAQVSYTKAGNYTLKFSAIAISTGQKVTREYTVRAMGRPVVYLRKVDENVRCVGEEVVYFVGDAEKNVPGTTYTLTIDDDKSSKIVRTNDEVLADNRFVHQYSRSYCSDYRRWPEHKFLVTLEVKNECYSDGATVDEHVVAKLQPAFSCDSLDELCTHHNVAFRNETFGAYDSDCKDDDVFYEWHFDDGTTSDQPDPDKRFDDPGEHEVTLIAYNKYSCATGDTSMKVSLAEEVYAIFEIEKDSLCVGDTLKIKNYSLGNSLLGHQWTITPLDGMYSPPFVDGTKFTDHNVKILFDHYGRYRVSFRLWNGCSEDEMDTVIYVRQDPNIRKFDLQDLGCIGDRHCLPMSSYTSFDWNGNNPNPSWTITRRGGGEGYKYLYDTEGEEFPYVAFTQTGTYNLKLELKSVGCGNTTIKAEKTITVYDTTLILNVQTGKLEICEGGTVPINCRAEGEGTIYYSWGLSSWDGVSQQYIDPSERDVVFTFNKYGTDTVHLHVATYCSSRDTSFEVRVHKESNIYLFEPPQAVCPDEVLDFSTCTLFQYWNNEEKAQWKITPKSGWEFIDGTDENSVYPKVKFITPGLYEFTVKLPQGTCSVEGVTQEATKKIRVRSSAMTLKLKADDLSVCEKGTLMFAMMANSAEDDPINFLWSVSSDSPEPDFEFDKNRGNQQSITGVTFNRWGTYHVRGSASGYCGTLDSTVNVTVKKDPEVHILREDVVYNEVCQGILARMEDYVAYEWYNNVHKATWTISTEGGGAAADGFSFEEGTDENTEYPVIQFKKKGNYSARIALQSAGCDATNINAFMRFTILDTTMYVSVMFMQRDICEGNVVNIENRSDGIGLTCNWTVSGGKADGWSYDEDYTGAMTDEHSMMPVFRFNHYGDYELAVELAGTCNRKVVSSPIKVRGVPDIEVAEKMEKICAGGPPVDMGDYVTIRDLKNNDVLYNWTVAPSQGTGFVPTDGRNLPKPQISFEENNHYRVTLNVSSQCASGGSQTYSSEIDVIKGTLKSAFAIDSAICVPTELVLQNTSDGDSLTPQWSIRREDAGAEAGWGFPDEEGAAQMTPRLALTDPGYYQIGLHVSNICGESDSVFRVHTFGVPEVGVESVADVCEPFTFSASDRIAVDGKNDVVTRAAWTVTTGDVFGAFDMAAMKPDIVFRKGTFDVNVKYWNRCSVPGEANFTVTADEYVPIAVLRDTAVCVLTDPFLLRAVPDTGVFSSADGDIVKTDGGYFFNPRFDAYFEGDIPVTYTIRNGSCTAESGMKVHILPLPRVDAQADKEMCVNHEPLPLAGLPAGGYWESEGAVLAGDLYVPTAPDTVDVYYHYTDANQCSNLDSIVLIVRPLPVTTFTTDSMPCRYADTRFFPDVMDGTRYEWRFGDDSPAVTTLADATHAYDGYGYFMVSNVATTPFGCVDQSAPVRIEVVNLPPDAYFDVDKDNGCPPYSVVFSLDEETYKDNHNHLSFHWDYGDSTKADGLLPLISKGYPKGVWDTTFQVTFTVKNKCQERRHDTLLTVNSEPDANFVLMHQWECSPVELELQNTTTGNRCKFTWSFGDGSPDETGRNVRHEYTTDGRSSTYRIKLVAQNDCKTSEHTESLVVKPRSLSAHFSPAVRFACVGDEVTFKNNSTDTVSYVENVRWDFADGAKDTTWDGRHVYLEGGNYRVQLYIENGCGFDTISDPITIYALPQIAILTEDNLCETDTFTMALQTDKPLKWIHWDLGDSTVDSREQFRHVYDGYGSFRITLEGIDNDIASCRNKTEKNIEVFPRPLVRILTPDTAGCTPFLYHPRVEEEGVNFYQWDYGDGSGPVSLDEHRYVNRTDNPQVRTVTLKLENDLGCKRDLTREVTVYGVPRANVEQEVTKGRPEKVHYLNLSEAYSDCLWILPDGEEQHSMGDWDLAFDKNGIYDVTLVAYNGFGCSDTVTVSHEVLMKGLFFPNTFIPHSRNDKVNKFNGVGIGLIEYRLEIYDQYGNKLWETSALDADGMPSEGWDGCNNKGKEMQQGVYIWRARAVFGDNNIWTGKNNDSGQVETVQGSVLLLRE